MGEWDDRLAVGEGLTARAAVDRLRRSDRDRAEATARSIRHPWYRCQSLTAVAEATVDPGLRGALLDKALGAASELGEPNQRVAAASIPLALLTTTAPPDRLARETVSLLADCATEPHTLRRLWALWHLIGAVWSQGALRDRVLDAFIATALESHGRGRDRLVSNIAERLGQAGDAWANDVAEMVEIGQLRRRALRRGTPAMADPQRKGWTWVTPGILEPPFDIAAPVEDAGGSDPPHDTR